MNIQILRQTRNGVCTLGTMNIAPGVEPLRTLELPWVPDPGCPGGAPDVSCVPPGLYQLVQHDTVKHPKSFALVNPALGVIHEPDPQFPTYRTACLIHIANFPQQLEGCIGVGLTAGDDEINNSAAALAVFNENVPWIGGHHTLEIIDPI
jgi:Family of unknown function (DUF5675)